jgi:chemotaxis protein CheD
MSEHQVIQVPIGGLAATRAPGVLTTLLGSCVGMIVQDLRNQIVVLAHVVRPDGSGAGMGPGYFANLAAPRARDLAIQTGANPRDLLVRMVGGGRMVAGKVDIGARNAEAIKEATYQLGMTFGGHLEGPADGGCFVMVDASTGKVVVKRLNGGMLDDRAERQAREEIGVPR